MLRLQLGRVRRWCGFCMCHAVLVGLAVCGIASDGIMPVTQGHDVQSDDVEVLYREALDTAPGPQRKERFRRVMLRLEREIADLGPSAGPGMYVNLGNAALQADEVGPAIVAYRHALAMAPNDRQARDNLKQARELLPEWIRWKNAARDGNSLFFWNQKLSADQVSYLASVLFFVAMVSVSLRARWRFRGLGVMALVFLLLWGILSLSLLPWMTPPNISVVIVDEVVARTADSISSAPCFAQSVPSGAEVIRHEQRGDWVRVEFDRQVAWLPISSLADAP